MRLPKARRYPSLELMQSTFRPPFESFVAPARAHADIWKLLAGLCLIILIYGVWTFGVFWSARALFPDLNLTGKTPASTFLFLGTFIGMALGPVVAARVFHKRGAATLMGRSAWVIHDFCVAVVVVGVIFAVSLALWTLWYDAVPNLDFIGWMTLLPLALVGLLIQTGAEELVFRGYLQQQLAARFSSPLVWMLIPSVLFGALHYDPITMGANLWFIVAATGLFGLAAADITAKTGSIGAAWGFHFANNVAALLVVSLDGPMTGLALFVTPYGADAAIMRYLIVIDMATVLVAWAILRRILQR